MIWGARAQNAPPPPVASGLFSSQAAPAHLFTTQGGDFTFFISFLKVKQGRKPIFVVFGLNRPGIELMFPVSVADVPSTTPVIGLMYIIPIFLAYIFSTFTVFGYFFIYIRLVLLWLWKRLDVLNLTRPRVPNMVL